MRFIARLDGSRTVASRFAAANYGSLPWAVIAVGAVDAVEAAGAEASAKGESFGLVGESGSGNAPLTRSILHLETRPPAASAFRARFSENCPTPSCRASIDSDGFRPQITSFGANHTTDGRQTLRRRDGLRPCRLRTFLSHTQVQAPTKVGWLTTSSRDCVNVVETPTRPSIRDRDKVSGRAQYPSQLSEPFLADYLDEAVEMFRPAEEPGECFFGDLEVLGVACT